ncbi:endonuclease III domain-containing protein [Sporomusa termitida]|uniref:Ultraviolet N-glycosylase/AP lyase n=1 Tax=Sporomusa termitida TaxID=2377 RepID=A0A517DPV7_9FIRM|nr:endonuclease III domain-containing protein [Sporomusa termitida]QDR79405.1 Ultraviolet N-glycosylase/AP lyase [Sporomusa termitida]
MRGLYELYNTLLTAYGQRNWWPAETPFEMMAGAILTQNTTWTNVEKALTNLGDRLSPAFIAGVQTEELAQLIRSSGYYNQKALKLKALTQWYEKYEYNIKIAAAGDGEALRAELLAVKGIGRETADSILLYALNKPFFVVDTYTKRLLHRLGYDLPATYDGLRLQLEAHLPQDVYLYGEFHGLIVEHAKRHCKKQPACAGCPVAGCCRQRM